MAITAINRNDVLRHSRQALGLPHQEPTLDEPMLAACLRRAAAIFCPCARATLVAAVRESLEYITDDSDNGQHALELALEGLVVIGDLLELDQVALNAAEPKSSWVFSAPPGFIARPDGTVFVIGIVADEVSPLPAWLLQRVVHQRYARLLTPEPRENLLELLRELGLLEHSERAWLKLPREVVAEEFCRQIKALLAAQPPSGTTDELLLLDPAANVDYYRGRWTTPKQISGAFVARRTQAFGAPIWGYALLEFGALRRFLDFPLKGFHWRGCDAAWHLQLAIDYSRGAPQHYRRRVAAGGAYLDFFSPIPLWAERKLAIVSYAVPPQHSLFSYFVPERNLATEENFLQTRLWLARHDESS